MASINDDLWAYYSAALRDHVPEERFQQMLTMFREPVPLIIRPLLTRCRSHRDDSNLPDDEFATDLRQAVDAVSKEASDCASPQTPELTWLQAWQAWEVTRVANQNFKSWGHLTQLLYRAEKTAECMVQELTSMLPALLLDPQASDTVCDLCAAPGSKSLQILHAMCKKETDAFASGGRGLVADDLGILIANELDAKRAKDLAIRLQDDAGHLSAHAFVTSCNAAIFPTLYVCDRLPQKNTVREHSRAHLTNVQKEEYGMALRYRLAACANSTRSNEQVRSKEIVQQAKNTETCAWYQRRKLKFNKILADVPCSGDGTMRKNPDIWESWSIVRGLGNFPRQLAILRRALEVLQEGGRCVYSTCSMNPLENEAVVAAAICLHNEKTARSGGGFVSLADGHALLRERVSGSIAANLDHGVTHWRVPSPSFSSEDPALFSDWNEVPLHLRHRRKHVRVAEAASEAQSKGVKLRPEMFQNCFSDTVDTSKCIRALPHANLNSGGFFVAVITKSTINASTASQEVVPRVEGWQLWADSRFYFPRMKATDPSMAIFNCYGLCSSRDEAASKKMDRFPVEQLAWAPSSGQREKTSLVLLPSTALRVQHHKEIRVLNGGLPIFERMASNSTWAQNAGLEKESWFSWRPVPGLAAAFLSSCATRRVLQLPLPLLCKLLLERRLPFEVLSGVVGLETCGPWSKAAQDSEGFSLVGGGVLVVPVLESFEKLPPSARAFAALISPQELLVLGSKDLRERCLEVLERRL